MVSSFLNLPPAEARLRPVTENSFPAFSSWGATQRRITGCSLPNSFYKPSLTRLVCVIVGALVVLGGICCRLAYLANAGLLTFPKMLVAIVTPLILLGGGMAVLCKLAYKTDVLYGKKIRPFMSRNWERVIVCEKEGEFIQFIRDQDTYMDILLPLVSVARMLYNLFRFLVIPFYIVFQMVYQFHQRGVPPEERFVCSDIIREMARSLLQAIKAPFYGAACYLASLYGLLNPLSGRVVLASVERDWNNDVIRSRGVWGIFLEKNYLLEGGGTRSGLGQHAWYLLG